jgi:hypothetical protein
MPSCVVTLTTDYQQVNILVAAKRTTDGLPPIPSNAKIKRITGGGNGMVFVSRSPLPVDAEDYRLATNEATPFFGNDGANSENLNCFWLKGEAGGETAKLSIDY